MSKNNTKFAEEHKREPIEYLTDNQERYGNAITEDIDYDSGDNAFVFATGSAGTGKTWLAATIASDLYLQKKYRKIVITRPTIPCGEDMGALPGDLDEKFDPWTEAVIAPVRQRIGVKKFECDYKKNILTVPIQFLRGATFDDSIIIVDEAQNCTVDQIKMLMTRIGEDSKMIFSGDISQDDQKFNYRKQEKDQSGLAWVVSEIKRQNEGGIEIIDFTWDDCVRSGACKKSLKIFQRSGK